MDTHNDNIEDHKDNTIRPVTAAQHGPPTVVGFIGVLSADPRLQHTSVPFSYQDHPLVRDRFFYTIPEELLEAVCRPAADESFNFDDELLRLELELSRISGEHDSRIGFWNNFPIACNFMKATPLKREDLAHLNLGEEQIEGTLRTANERLLSFSEITCGYAGWLMTNAEFRTEFNALAAEFGEQMSRWGTAMVGLPIPSTQPPGLFNPTGEEGWDAFDAAVLEFCVRWCLQGLAGPRIPIPMRPMMSGQFPLSIVDQLQRAGGVFNWPDTFPIFARNELRDMLADALQSSVSSEHLAGWQCIIDPKNKAKNQIGALERRFRLQHFWRLLRERHPGAFNRRLNRVEQAFAQYFGIDDSTIRLDRNVIAKGLGDDWDLAVKPVASVQPPR